MKKTGPFIAVCIAMTTVCASGACAGAGMAPMYPGPVESGPEVEYYWVQEGDVPPRVYQTYKTRDAFEKVVEYYTKEMDGSAPDVSELEARFDGEKGSPLQYDAVIIRRSDSGLSEGVLFDPLKKEISQGAAGMKTESHTWKDLDDVKTKYGYLAGYAFFPGFSAEKKLAECRKTAGADTDAAKQDNDALMKKIQELGQQGRFAEMQRLMDDVVGLADNVTQAEAVSHWDEWVACLDELDRRAFRAVIWIRKK